MTDSKYTIEMVRCRHETWWIVRGTRGEELAEYSTRAEAENAVDHFRAVAQQRASARP